MLTWKAGKIQNFLKTASSLNDFVRKSGAGDTSIAAFLYAAMQGCTPKESVEYAAATRCVLRINIRYDQRLKVFRGIKGKDTKWLEKAEDYERIGGK